MYNFAFLYWTKAQERKKEFQFFFFHINWGEKLIGRKSPKKFLTNPIKLNISWTAYLAFSWIAFFFFVEIGLTCKCEILKSVSTQNKLE